MDKLTNLIREYKETGTVVNILKVQRIIYPIINKLLTKWKFDKFPKLIFDDLLNEAKTIVLLEAIKKFKVDGGSKFTSFYGTSLNFYLRHYYMKYFQKGKPIRKRWGRLHELSLEYTYNSLHNTGRKRSLADFMQEDETIRENLDLKLIAEAVERLTQKKKRFIKDRFYKKISRNKLRDKYKMTYSKLKKTEKEILEELRLSI